MKSTDPIEVNKVPFSDVREKPKQEEIAQPENTVYEPVDIGNGYESRFTEQIRELDEKIKAVDYQRPDLKDQEKQSFVFFERDRITEVLRLLRILSIPRTAVYTIEDLEDIEEFSEPIYASITKEILTSEAPENAAVLLTDKNGDELKEAMKKIPEELVLLVRNREWMAAYDRWNAYFFQSPPATWFYDDINPEDCCRIIILGALAEICSWLEDETAPVSLITHLELPHKNVGYHMAGRFNFEEQCMEMYSNAPLKGLTVKLIKNEESDMGFLIEDIYPDTADVY